MGKNKAVIQKYYIPFVPLAKVDYRFIILLYGLADFNTDTKCYDTITYKSVSALAATLDKSPSAVNRILKNDEYKPFFSVDKTAKKITLKNNITREKTPFVCLNYVEIDTLIGLNDNLIIKYFMYIKYYCGYAKSKETDSTAKQILAALGYSTQSSYIDKLAEYNTLLKAENLIRIRTYTDDKGYKRNIYSIP